MSMGHDSNDGSDIFWPGYVDATTNLILNLLFLLTILIVAVFMFALELGRASKVDVETQAENPTKPSEMVMVATPDPIAENMALKTEIKRLNMLLAQRDSQSYQSAGLAKKADATASRPKPLDGLDEMKEHESEVVVHFKSEAVAFTPEEHDQLLETLKPVAESENASIYVEVPAGFSGTKRIGFYRAMAVRNLLIEMNMPGEKIDISVVDGDSDADSSVIRVQAH